ncbi:acyl-CoA synthetase FdrA [Cellulomonas chengniuliangii]|uniref:acyl-CoA synthetase FdrA n=1 Tax=Cellulomonas chengniuliangii TaxID=2968084 RepID=UPI001D0E43B9|nr:acyl-CoA synthetase FdrA [Cellulomonas chengniuliangii]MCC2317057.1 acyl-CoA synthetase FdrA [Cellulomonas chengniuliangii]
MSAPDSTVLRARVLPRLYRDSVALMALASSTEKRDGVRRVGAVMATPGNLEILERSSMRPADLVAAPDDLLLVVRADDEAIADAALDSAEAGLTAAEQSTGERVEQLPQSIAEGVAAADGATLATISTPGAYAPAVAEQALRHGLHVFCFSDNVSIEDEVRLKRLAVDRGLLLMGPDCGTAILDGVPLGFANVVQRGSVGIVAASGTGAQEVSCLLDLAGCGVSQLIGVGGRDLSTEVDGLMTHHALDMLAADEATEVVVVVSKPPAPAVAERLLARLAILGKPVVACLLGLPDSDGPVVVRGTLEGGAIAAAELAGHPLAIEAAATPDLDVPLTGGVLGLYTGGTLASESKVILGAAGVQAEILDLGDDEFTAGRPHPMIEPAERSERVAAAGADPQVGLVLVDLVLGYGASADPAAPLAEAVRTARAAAAADGRELVVVGSVCGAPDDPQGIDAQRAVLREAGVLLHPSNASAARYAATRATVASTGALSTSPKEDA